MPSQFHSQSQQIKTRKAVLIFLKHAGPPVVLYSDEPEELYADLRTCMEKANNAVPKLVERQVKGPVKVFSVMDNVIAGVAIQEEPYM